MSDHDGSREYGTYLPLTLLFFAVAIRIPFTSKMLFHQDSVNFALALDRYDLSVHQPHPPGYFLYVMLGRLIHLVIADANLVFVAISIAFTSLTVILVYLLAKEMYDQNTAIVASLLAVVSPNLWFHAEVALSYAAEGFFSALLGYICWRIHQGRYCLIWMSALMLGVAGGFRQNSMLFFFPLWLFAARKAPARTMVYALILLGAVCLAWFIPMLRQTGGVEAYTAAFSELWEFSTGHNSVFDRRCSNLWLFSRTLFIFNLYGLGTGAAVMGVALYTALRNGELHLICQGKRGFYAAWILPSYIFYQLIYIHPANPGYSLIFLPPLLLLCARGTLRVGEKLKEISGRSCMATLVIGVMMVNAWIFLFSQLPISR